MDLMTNSSSVISELSLHKIKGFSVASHRFPPQFFVPIERFDPCTVAHPNSTAPCFYTLENPVTSPYSFIFCLLARRCPVLVQHSVTGTATSFRGSPAFLAILFFPPLDARARTSIEVERHARRRRERREENS